MGRARWRPTLSRPATAILVAKGGRGGRGNVHFSSINRAPRPRRAGRAGPGEEPTARAQAASPTSASSASPTSESTLLPPSPRAPPKIADYPFTTLVPNLGVVPLGGERDLSSPTPGPHRGGAAGRGLGPQFLRHLERTRVLLHLVDVSSVSGRDPVEDFDTIREELKFFDEQVFAKPQLTVATKLDALDEPERLERLAAHVAALGLPFMRISAVTGEGLPALLETLWQIIEANRDDGDDRRRHPCPVADAADDGPGPAQFRRCARGHDAPASAWASWAARSIRCTSAISTPPRRLGRALGARRGVVRAVARSAAPAAAIRWPRRFTGSRWSSLAVVGAPRPIARATSSCAAPGRPTPSTRCKNCTRQGWAPSQLFFIIGVDAFAEVATWRAYPAVLERGELRRRSRARGLPAPQLAAQLPELSARIATPGITPRNRDRNHDLPGRGRARGTCRRRSSGNGFVDGESIADLVPAPVERHIMAHGLYGSGKQIA